VVYGGVEVSVVGDVEGLEKGCAGYGVKSGFGLLAIWRGGFQEGGEGVTKARPGAGTE
jgi:hypothetical protein